MTLDLSNCHVESILTKADCETDSALMKLATIKPFTSHTSTGLRAVWIRPRAINNQEPIYADTQDTQFIMAVLFEP